jgi:hypothetical protein
MLMLGLLFILGAGSCSSDMSAGDCTPFQFFMTDVCLACDASGQCTDPGHSRCLDQCDATHLCTYSAFPTCGASGYCVATNCSGGSSGGPDGGTGVDAPPGNMTP